MKPVQYHVCYGSRHIVCEVLFADRKTMGITVHPDKRVVVRAPRGADLDWVKARLQKRARWIKRQLDYFSQFDPRTPARRYVGGESHLYLGRHYRLKIRAGETPGVKLRQGYFNVTVNGDVSPQAVKALMDQWYLEKAGQWFPELLADHLPAFQPSVAAGPRLVIRKMKTRWGSLSARDRITLNLDLIRAPRECLEYVIIHELCHLEYRYHDAAFYRLLEKHLPDWKQRKHKLERALA